jgi:hypothetical protein
MPHSSETVSVTSVTESKNVINSNNDESMMPEFLKNISNNDLLLGIGFCILLLAVILFYLYYKSTTSQPQQSSEITEKETSEASAYSHQHDQAQIRPSQKQLHREREQSHREQEKPVKRKAAPKLEHPKLSEESESSTVVSPPSSPKTQKLSQYDLTNSEIGEINEKLKQVKIETSD